MAVGVTAPDQPGRYVLRHRMYRENVWCEQIERIEVTVTADAERWKGSSLWTESTPLGVLSGNDPDGGEIEWDSLSSCSSA